MSTQEDRIPEEDDTTEAPLTMAASVVLTTLPRDASTALETAGNMTVQKSKPIHHFISFFSLLLPPSLFSIHAIRLIHVFFKSNRPSSTHRLGTPFNPARLQTQYESAVRHDCAVFAQEVGRQGI
jgi:hypothetical protein